MKTIAPKTAPKFKIQQIEYHRNGISGEPFNVVKFHDPENGDMLGIVFPLDEGETWNGRVAVFKLDLLAQGNISFGQNSWRGDHYEKELRDAIGKDE
jgi:hypothetical protein